MFIYLFPYAWAGYKCMPSSSDRKLCSYLVELWAGKEILLLTQNFYNLACEILLQASFYMFDFALALFKDNLY